MSNTNTILRRIAVIIIFAGFGTVLAACGGTNDLSCDKPQRYQAAVEAGRVQTPDDLDELDQFKELPLPEASPRPPRPEGSPCLDLPPSILGDGQ